MSNFVGIVNKVMTLLPIVRLIRRYLRITCRNLQVVQLRMPGRLHYANLVLILLLMLSRVIRT